MAAKYTEDQVKAALDIVPDWNEVNGEIQRTYQFNDFVQAMRFVDRVAAEAESREHHPDILIRYNKVTLSVSTHDAGGITEKDFDLAKAIDAFA